MKKKIILFGGAGFIGHNLALKLSTFGHEVVVVDSLQINNIYYFMDGRYGVLHKAYITQYHI